MRSPYAETQVCSVCGGFYTYPLIREYPKDSAFRVWAWECNECVVAHSASLNKSILEYQKERQSTANDST